jgi:hypothetical protein
VTETRVVLTGDDAFSLAASADPDALEIHINDQVTLVGSKDALLAAVWNVAALVQGTRLARTAEPPPR